MALQQIMNMSEHTVCVNRTWLKQGDSTYVDDQTSQIQALLGDDP